MYYILIILLSAALLMAQPATTGFQAFAQNNTTSQAGNITEGNQTVAIFADQPDDITDDPQAEVANQTSW